MNGLSCKPCFQSELSPTLPCNACNWRFPMALAQLCCIYMGNHGSVTAHTRTRSGPVNLLQHLPTPTPRTFSVRKARLISSQTSTDVIHVNVRKRKQISLKAKAADSAPLSALKKQTEPMFTTTPDLVKSQSLYTWRDGLGRGLKSEKKYRLMRQGSRTMTSPVFTRRRSSEETKDNVIRPLPELQTFHPSERQSLLFSEIPSRHEHLAEHQHSLQLHAISSPVKVSRTLSLVPKLRLTKEL